MSLTSLLGPAPVHPAALWLCLVSLALCAALLAMACYNAATAVRLEDHDPDAGPDDPQPVAERPLCSLLIPARNEGDNLRRHLPLLAASSGANLEIVILDDNSTDDTLAVASDFADHAPVPVRVLRGAPLPPGWLGKNWACHQLSQAARGEILIFCDADVAVGPRAVARTATCMRDRRLDGLTVLPRQVMGTVAEQAALPFIMHLPVLGLLPLRLVAEVPSPKMVVANGQWFAFRRAAYQAIGGHAAVRDQIVEDMALAVNLKRADAGRSRVEEDGPRRGPRTPYQSWDSPPSGRRLLPVLAVEDLQVRMYQGAGELSRGFAKNLYLLIGGHPATLLLFVLIFSAMMLAPLGLPLLVPGVLGLVPLLVLVILRAVVLVLTRAPLRTALLHPMGALWILWLMAQSALRLRRGEVRWKGRPVVQPG